MCVRIFDLNLLPSARNLKNIYAVIIIMNRNFRGEGAEENTIRHLEQRHAPQENIRMFYLVTLAWLLALFSTPMVLFLYSLPLASFSGDRWGDDVNIAWIQMTDSFSAAPAEFS